MTTEGTFSARSLSYVSFRLSCPVVMFLDSLLLGGITLKAVLLERLLIFVRQVHGMMLSCFALKIWSRFYQCEAISSC